VHNIIVREWWWWFVSGLREATLLNLVFFDTVLRWLAPNMSLFASEANDSRAKAKHLPSSRSDIISCCLVQATPIEDIGGHVQLWQPIIDQCANRGSTSRNAYIHQGLVIRTLHEHLLLVLYTTSIHSREMVYEASNDLPSSKLLRFPNSFQNPSNAKSPLYPTQTLNDHHLHSASHPR
jgi:hypothetical protein